MFIKKLHALYFFAGFFMIFNLGNAQIEKNRIKLGVSYGTGAQDRFPFNLKDYTHKVVFYKAHFNYRVIEKVNWTFEFTAEPSYNIVEHQLLNKWFIKPSNGNDYLEQRDIFTKERAFREYVLNMGVIARYNILKQLSAYAVGTVGPMIAEKRTERLASGFAFSDVFGIGISFDINNIRLDFRYSVRHTSNFELKQPNNGHNTTNTELAILLNL